MKDHYCLHNKRERKQALKAFDKALLYWRSALFLRGWSFTIEEVDNPPTDKHVAGVIDPALSAVTFSDPPYKRARMTFWMDDDDCVGGLGIETVACHEMLHVLLSVVTHPFETMLRKKISAGQFKLIVPLLYSPEEGICEDLAFNLVEAKLAEEALTKKKKRPNPDRTRRKKTPAGS